MKEPNSESINDSVETNFSGVADRIKAAVADTFIMVGLFFVMTYTFSTFETVPTNVRIIGSIIIFGLYDPLLTSLFGGTIGHMMMDIRVKRHKNIEKNILFPYAVIRYIFKYLLGFVSLLTIGSDQENKAIHDMVAGSVVVYKA